MRFERARTHIRAQHAQAWTIERLQPLRRRRSETACQRLSSIRLLGVIDIPDQRDVAKHDASAAAQMANMGVYPLISSGLQSSTWLPSCSQLWAAQGVGRTATTHV